MDSLYNTYLKMLTTPFDDPSSDLPDISPEDYPALFALADRHCTLPFVLPYFRNTGLYPQILQKSKHMMLNSIRSISSHVARYRFWKSMALPALL